MVPLLLKLLQMTRTKVVDLDKIYNFVKLASAAAYYIETLDHLKPPFSFLERCASKQHMHTSSTTESLYKFH
jgi:hypothetical protein